MLIGSEESKVERYLLYLEFLKRAMGFGRAGVSSL
jgi:hypothetical protein